MIIKDPVPIIYGLNLCKDQTSLYKIMSNKTTYNFINY